jgi:hypothetical protein
MQLDSSQAELPSQYQDFDGNNYVQLYDERGNPINPRSRAYGKKLRNAQNDVLAAVGVVERRRSPSEGLPGSYEQRLDELDVEDTIGNALVVTVMVTEHLCTWWIGNIRDRLLVRIAISLSPTLAHMRRLSDTPLLHRSHRVSLQSARCLVGPSSMQASHPGYVPLCVPSRSCIAFWSIAPWIDSSVSQEQHRGRTNFSGGRETS